MKLDVRRKGSVAIVDIEGPLDGEAGGPSELRARVREILDGGASGLVLNVDRIPTTDSLTLAAVVQAHIDASRRGLALKLLRAGPRLRELLRVTKLDTVIELFDSEEAAVASVGPQA